MQRLTPEEILCLDKMNGQRIDDTEYNKRFGGVVEKLISCGYLMIGTKAQSLTRTEMGIIRKLLKDKGEKAGGKKADLIQRVLQSYSTSELESAEIPKRFVLTETGEKVVSENDALLYYFESFGATNILMPDQIISAQKAYPEESALGILIKLFKERGASENDTGKKRAITSYLCRLYKLNHDDELAKEVELEVEHLDKLWEAERESEARRLDGILGLTFEDRQRIRQELVDKANSDTMSEEEFFEFVDGLCEQLSEEMYRKELRRIAIKCRNERKGDSVCSLREEIELDFNSMLRAEQYYKTR